MSHKSSPRIEVEPALKPVLPPPQHIRPVLLGRMGGPFFTCTAFSHGKNCKQSPDTVALPPRSGLLTFVGAAPGEMSTGRSRSAGPPASHRCAWNGAAFGRPCDEPGDSRESLSPSRIPKAFAQEQPSYRSGRMARAYLPEFCRRTDPAWSSGMPQSWATDARSGVEPVPALALVGRRGLPGVGHQESLLLGKRVHPGTCGKVIR